VAGSAVSVFCRPTGLGFHTWYMYNLARGSNWSNILPQGSYVLKFLEKEEFSLGGTGRYYVCFDHPQFDLSSASDRAAL